MSHYIVSYNITVDVCVDLDKKTIDKVVLNDEDMGGPYAYFTAGDNYEIQDQLWNTSEGLSVDDEELVNKLFAIVEGIGEHVVEWPAWDHGW